MALVMYDLDGTLIDTASEIAMAVNLTLKQYGYAEVSEAQVRLWIGHGTAWLMRQAWPAQVSVAPWEMVMQDFMRHYNAVLGTKSALYPHVLETLQAMQEQGVKQAVVTNKEEPYTSRVLQTHGIAQYFDVVIGGNTLPVRKPNAQVVQYCMAVLGQTTANSLFVGDSETDVTTAKNADVVCWVVPYGYNAGRDIREANADKVIDNVSEVLGYFKESVKV